MDQVNPYAAPRAIDAPPPPVTTTAEFRSVTPLAKAITGVLVLNGVDAIVHAVIAFMRYRLVVLRDTGGSVTEQDVLAIKTFVARFGYFGAAVGALDLVLFCMFMVRANRNARRFSEFPLRFTPGWAAGVFFVPIWFFYKPYQAMKEIWLRSNPDGSPEPSLAGQKAPSFMRWWWALFLLSWRFWEIRASTKAVSATLQTLESSFALQLFGTAISFGSIILAVVVVRAVARRQDERQRRITAAATP